MAPLPLTLLLGVLIALTPLGTDTCVPALPAIAADLGAPASAAQLTLTAFFAGVALGQLGWGPLSDRFGRRPMLLAGLGLGLVASLAALAAGSVGALAWIRLAQGLGFSSGPVLARAVVRDLYAQDDAARMLARVMLVFSIAPIAAPVAGALLVGAGGWRAVFWALAAVMVLVLAASLRLEETAPAKRRSIHPFHLAATFAAIVREPRFTGPWMVMLSTQIGILAFVAGSSFALIEGLGVPAQAYGLLFATMMLGQIGGSWACARLVPRAGGARLMRRGAMLLAMAGVAAAIASTTGILALLVASFLCFMFAAALTIPNAQAAALTPFRETAGAASSLIGAATFGIGAGISQLLGAAFDGTARPMGVLAATAGLCALLAERLHARRSARWKA